VFREWAMANMLLSLFFLPMGLSALAAVALIVINRKRGGVPRRAGMWMTPLFFVVALYYSWVLEVSVARALAYASIASLAYLLWAWMLDRGTRSSS